MAAVNMLNFNVGILGHVDSGKTALAKAVSTVASTASFDKNPQSQERGITLDLGFSSFCVDIPEHMKRDDDKLEILQFTFVDCPGHASLIKTVIGGAQVIDLMLLVIDVTKGMQTQTAECLVIGQITCQKMIVVLNKVDLLAEATRQATIDKMTKRMLKTLENTRFAGCPVVAVAAKPGGPEAPNSESIGINNLVDTLKSCSFLPKRDMTGAFTYAVDHCFLIRGQGTIMTGTVLSGSVTVGDTIEIAAMKVTKKVKSMQVFRKPVNMAVQGDRVGICVTQFDAKQLERGLVCSPGALPLINAAIIAVQKVDYFRGVISTKAKFHITIGHETVMARVSFFGLHSDVNDIEKLSIDATVDKFDFSHEYVYQEELIANTTKPCKDAEHAYANSVTVPSCQFALLQFEHQVICPQGCLVIGSKLDTDIHANVCRLAFHGKLLELMVDPNYVETMLPSLKVYKMKKKEGIVDRKVDDYTVVCRGLLKKESKIEMFTGLKVILSTGEEGVIEGSFGQSGKFKVRMPGGLSESTSQLLVVKGKKSKSKGDTATSQETRPAESIKVLLTFKRYIYDPKKEMIQK